MIVKNVKNSDSIIIRLNYFVKFFIAEVLNGFCKPL